MNVRFPNKQYFILAFALLCSSNLPAQRLEFSGNLALESRFFPESPLLMQQFENASFSLSFKPELYYEWDDGDQSLLFVPFGRLDQHDGERSHIDIRELYWQRVWNAAELSIGLRKIFWGVTETQHLVDVINQNDQLENLDGEDKLGQPMVNLSLIQDWGTLDIYVMPWFRERRFLSEEARLRFPFEINNDAATYESDDEEKHVDWALRLFKTIGAFDIGISHFSGTSREPMLIPGQNGVFTPHYPLIDQTGLDVQATLGGWLLKLEAINRQGFGDRYVASVGGFEYTFPDVKGSGIDVGMLIEYHYDERGKAGFTPFDDDVFFGSRIAFNDVQSTDLLFGGVIDNDTGSSFLNLEASRRLGDAYRIEVEFRSFLNSSMRDVFYGLRQDSYLQLELARYF